MTEQLDLFEISKDNESPLRAKSEKQASRKSSLVDRQHRLLDFLKNNFISGRYYTIEELVDRVVDSEGKPYYKLNTNPYIHDKCSVLSSDIRAINWSITDRYHIIIKDTKGSAKLVESEQEFNEWVEKEKAPLIKKLGYLSNLKWKEDREGTMPMVNLANRTLDSDELDFIEVNAR